MSVGLQLNETMSGWLQLDGDGIEHSFAFSIQAFTTRIFSLSVPRVFRGVVDIDGQRCECAGELTIHMSGPHYWLEFDHPALGSLRAEGKKTYGKGGWVQSLITCPLTIYRAGKPAGRAEVAYRDSMLTFPFKALRLVREENAFGESGALS